VVIPPCIPIIGVGLKLSPADRSSRFTGFAVGVGVGVSVGVGVVVGSKEGEAASLEPPVELAEINENPDPSSEELGTG